MGSLGPTAAGCASPFAAIRLSQLDWEAIENLYRAMAATGLQAAWIRRCATVLTQALVPYADKVPGGGGPGVLRRLAVVAVCLLADVSCGTGSDGGAATSVEAGGRSVPLDEATGLQELFDAERRRPMVVAVDGGALILGGAMLREGSVERQRLEPTGEVFLVETDARVTELTAPPVAAPLDNLSVSAWDGAVHMAGVTCRTGYTPSDIGELGCEPGDPILLRLDLIDRTWEEVARPTGAPTPRDVQGALGTYTFGDGGVAYSVLGDEPDATMRTWVSTNGGGEWNEIDVPPNSGLCATGGALLAVDDSRMVSPETDGPAPVETPLTPDADFDLGIARYDPASAAWDTVPETGPADLRIVRGGNIGRCTPDAGYVVLALTGSGDGFVSYHPDHGWVSDGSLDGASVGGLTSTSSTTVVLIGAPGSDAIALDVATGGQRSVSLPESSEVLGGVGASHLLLLGAELEMIES
ncbi:MAG TPA: hypothetical protein VEW93_14025 [Acidimicrobiales bacterium]|nr:hypothetical protein [Acidimicrobiales bacterium]